MSEPVQRRHVLEPFLNRVEKQTAAECGVAMEVLPFRGYFNLRGDPKDSDFLDSVGEVLGQPLPADANTFTGSSCRTFWLGSDEWLIMTEPGVEEPLQSAFSGRAYALTDLTGGQICIRLWGANARNVLAKGCTLDFHPREFPPGSCAQTVLGKTSMLVCLFRTGLDPAGSGDTNAPADSEPADHREVFDIIVRRTFAEYAAEWLYRSAEEYGVRVHCHG